MTIVLFGAGYGIGFYTRKVELNKDILEWPCYYVSESFELFSLLDHSQFPRIQRYRSYSVDNKGEDGKLLRFETGNYII